MKTRVLALNAYHGGSHRAFLDGWTRHSRHAFEVLALPAYKWKWRMRHAAVTFAEQLGSRSAESSNWDAVVCTDMLNLAEFRGLSPKSIASLPTVVYFHENQLTYPNRHQNERDLHYAFTNLTTALSADAVWFNSLFHQHEFINAMDAWLRRMPDFQPLSAIDAIARKSAVIPPGIDAFPQRKARRPGPLRIVWVARWEHDKDPETFFAALRLFRDKGVSFRLSVLGESFGEAPACFQAAREQFADCIDHWGYLDSVEDYRSSLQVADVVVSTAQHEFFGIGVVEAVAAGCFPLVPRKLAYPEVLGNHDAIFHDGTAPHIAARLSQLASRTADGAVWPSGLEAARLVEPYCWPNAADRLDTALERVIEN